MSKITNTQPNYVEDAMINRIDGNKNHDLEAIDNQPLQFHKPYASQADQKHSIIYEALEEAYTLINAELFGGRLATPYFAVHDTHNRIKTSAYKHNTIEGRDTGKGFGIIHFNLAGFTGTNKQAAPKFLEALLHEMIHIWTIFTGDVSGDSHNNNDRHGPAYVQVAESLDITVAKTGKDVVLIPARPAKFNTLVDQLISKGWMIDIQARVLAKETRTKTSNTVILTCSECGYTTPVRLKGEGENKKVPELKCCDQIMAVKPSAKKAETCQAITPDMM